MPAAAGMLIAIRAPVTGWVPRRAGEARPDGETRPPAEARAADEARDRSPDARWADGAPSVKLAKSSSLIKYALASKSSRRSGSLVARSSQNRAARLPSSRSASTIVACRPFDRAGSGGAHRVVRAEQADQCRGEAEHAVWRLAGRAGPRAGRRRRHPGERAATAAVPHVDRDRAGPRAKPAVAVSRRAPGDDLNALVGGLPRRPGRLVEQPQARGERAVAADRPGIGRPVCLPGRPPLREITRGFRTAFDGGQDQSHQADHSGRDDSPAARRTAQGAKGEVHGLAGKVSCPSGGTMGIEPAVTACCIMYTSTSGVTVGPGECPPPPAANEAAPRLTARAATAPATT